MRKKFHKLIFVKYFILIKFNIIDFSNKSIENSQNTSRDVSTHLSPSKIESTDYSEGPRKVIIMYHSKKWKIREILKLLISPHIQSNRILSSVLRQKFWIWYFFWRDDRRKASKYIKNNFNPGAIGWDTSIPLCLSNFLKDILQPTSSKISPT